MAGEQDEVVRSLRELLAIAKLAMPEYLFEIDPRIHRARQLVATRTQVASGQPPSIAATAPIEMVHLVPPPTMEDVDRMPGAAPPWDITAGLDAFMESDLAPETRTEAVVLILRDWLIGHGYIDPPPEQDN